MSASGQHPFLKAIEDLPSRFPELKANDQLAQIATMIVIPNLKIAAKKDPEAIRAATVRFLSRFVIGLEIKPEEIYDAAAIAAVHMPLAAAGDSAAVVATSPAIAPPATDPNLDRVLAGDN